MEGSIVSQLLIVSRYAYPFFILLYFVVASTIALCLPPSVIYLPQRNDTISRLFLLVMLCFSLDGAVGVAGVIFWSLWPSQEDIIGLVSCVFTFSIIAQSSKGTSTVITWHWFYGAWAIGFFCDILTAVLQCISSQDTHVVHYSKTLVLFHASLAFIRCVLFGIISSLLLWQDRQKHTCSSDEEAPLLPSPTLSSSFAHVDAATSSAIPPGSQNDWVLRFQKLMILSPYIWPQNSRDLQIRIVLTGLCILANNGINLLVPRQYGILIDYLRTSLGKNPWPDVALFMALRLLSSEAGIQIVQKMLWRLVEEYWEKALTTAAFSHIMHLSADFHDSTDPTDLQMAIMSGNSISHIAEMACFRAIPTMIDLAIAIIYLSVKFGQYEGLIIFATVVVFIKFSLRAISSAEDQQRQVWERRSDESKSRYYSISRWFTVLLFNHTEDAISSYSKALESRLIASRSVDKSNDISSAIRYLISSAGLLASIWVVVYQIHSGEATAGDLVLLFSYWGQITAPLGFFVSLGRGFNQQLTELERLVGILHQVPNTADNVGAQPLQLQSTNVEFQGVSFSYDGKKYVLDDFNMSVPSGHTVALVGPTGSGKSTILNLLRRAYPIQKGSISIDGKDIGQVTQTSLQSIMGLVPQSPQLFEKTILENVRYARPDASDQEVHDACKAAAIHEQIMGFPEGYQTCVGGYNGNGKLSTGQIQRIAIARVILMDPQIVLLDEATSSVDTDTEHLIQKALDSLCKSRTTFIIAHRLSTGMKADMIYVISEGKIIERGTHQELISQGGKYTSLWSKQTSIK
ncbi:P-loop containing nucleoside triphosphate hydrolase protein [Xylaria sp. FL0064]|nr:P-loop containing nucleoside triphosphate hydrolase protein [Xylaria sp. FL0064]